MTTEDQNFTLYAGDDISLTFAITDEDTLLPKNLTGASMIWVLYDDDISVIKITKTTVSGIVFTNEVGGLGTISVNAEESVDLVPTKNYRHEAEVTDSSGNESTVFTGIVIIKGSKV